MDRIRAALSRSGPSKGPFGSFGVIAGLAALRASRPEAQSSVPRTLGEETSTQGPTKNQGVPIVKAAAKPDGMPKADARPGARHWAPPPKALIRGPPLAPASAPKADESAAFEADESTPEAAASTPEAVAMCIDGTTPKASVKTPIVVDGFSTKSPALVKASIAAESGCVVGQIPEAPEEIDAPLPEWKHPEIEIETEEAAELPMASEDLASRETDPEPSLEDSTPKVAEESSPEFVNSAVETQPEPQVYEPAENLSEWLAEEDEIESQPAAPLPKARPVFSPAPETTEPEKTWERPPPELETRPEPEKTWEWPPEPETHPEPEKTWQTRPEKRWERPPPEPEIPPEPEKTWEGSKSSCFRYPHVWHKSSYGWQAQKFDNKWSPDATADGSTWSGSWGWKSRGKWSPSSWKSRDWEQQPQEVDDTQQNEVENWEQRPEEQNEVQNWQQQPEEQNEVESWERRPKEQNEVENWEQRPEEQNEVENWQQQPEEQNEVESWEQRPKEQNEVGNWEQRPEEQNWQQQPEEQNGVENWEQRPQEQNEVENWEQRPEEQNEVENWQRQPEEQNEVENWERRPEEQNEVENWEQRPEEVNDTDSQQKEVEAPEKLERKNDEAEAPEDPEALPAGHFSVMLTKNHDESWGFNWDPQSGAKGFRCFAEASKGSPIDLWNQENPSKAVAFGDELVEVNSAKTADKIKVELTKPMVFCVFKRAEPMTEQDPLLEDQGDTGPAVVTTSVRSVPVRPKTLPPPPSHARERRLPSGTLEGQECWQKGRQNPLLDKFSFLQSSSS